MVIFHSYVSLPEGTLANLAMVKNHQHFDSENEHFARIVSTVMQPRVFTISVWKQIET